MISIIFILVLKKETIIFSDMTKSAAEDFIFKAREEREREGEIERDR